MYGSGSVHYITTVQWFSDSPTPGTGVTDNFPSPFPLQLHNVKENENIEMLIYV